MPTARSRSDHVDNGYSELAVHQTILVVDIERFGDPARSNRDRVRDALYQM